MGNIRRDIYGNIYMTKEEVVLHNKYEDIWIIAHDKVYDVTKYISNHPGGELSITRKAGTDCTRDYDFHSSNGKKIWKKYEIGFIEKNNNCILS